MINGQGFCSSMLLLGASALAWLQQGSSLLQTNGSLPQQEDLA